MRKISQDKFEEDIRVWGNKEYEAVGIYQGSGKPTKILHKLCGNIYMGTRDNFKQGKRCPVCFGKPEIDSDTFREWVHSEVGEEYTVVGDYKNAKTKITFTHNDCGHTYEATPHKFKLGRRCPKCYSNYLKTTEEFRKEVQDIHGDNFRVLGKYEGANIPIRVEHVECGAIYDTYPNNIKRVVGCNACGRSSRGEHRIKQYLDSREVKYQQQATYPDCRRVLLLPFDFKVYTKKEELLIEYDGIQHFEPVEIFGGVAYLETVKENDNIKTEYCEVNGLKLLRIPYTEYENIEKILAEVLEE